MAKKVKSPSYASYKAKDSYAKNKKLKLQRHLKKHENDRQASMALGEIKSYSRKKPTNKLGWVSENLRNKLLYVPYLTNKGTPIVIKNTEQLEALFSKMSQPQSGTKQNLMLTAKWLKFSNVSAYHPTLVSKSKKDSTLVWKHTAKTSNFKAA